MILPDGRIVPQVRQDARKAKERQYTYLGTDEQATWKGAQEPVRRKVAQFCSHLMRLVGRVGVMDDRQVKKGMELGTEGSMGFYARTTIVGDATCEEIERTRADVLKQVGIA